MKAAQPLVSVVIPTYKRLELLKRSINSVLNQTYSNWELILSDDEEPAGATWEYISDLANHDSRIHAFRNQGPHGQVGNVNFALQQVSGAWVKLCYDDDVLRNGCLAEFIAAVSTYNNVALVSCMADHYMSGKLVKQDRRGKERLELIPSKTAHFAMYLQDVEIGIPTQVLVNKKALENGAYLTDLKDKIIYAVDTLWFANILKYGDLLLLNKVLVEEHQGGHDSLTSSVRQDETILDSEMLVLKEELYGYVDPELHPPSIVVMKQSNNLMRAVHRLKCLRLIDAFVLFSRSWHPSAWFITAKWFLRRMFPGHFYQVPRIYTVD
jgi:glycosyltransferase involved in cell wall biosynthesis